MEAPGRGWGERNNQTMWILNFILKAAGIGGKVSIKGLKRPNLCLVFSLPTVEKIDCRQAKVEMVQPARKVPKLPR